MILINYDFFKEKILHRLSLGDDIIRIFEEEQHEQFSGMDYAHFFATCLIEHQVDLRLFSTIISYIYDQHQVKLDEFFKPFFIHHGYLTADHIALKNTKSQEQVFKYSYLFWKEQHGDIVLDDINFSYLTILIEKSFVYNNHLLWKGKYGDFLSLTGYDFIKIKPLIELGFQYEPRKTLYELFDLFHTKTDMQLIYQHLSTVLPDLPQKMSDLIFKNNKGNIQFDSHIFHLCLRFLELSEIVSHLHQSNQILAHCLSDEEWKNLVLDIDCYLHSQVKESATCCIEVHLIDLTKTFKENFIYLSVLAEHIQQGQAILTPDFIKYYHKAFEQPTNRLENFSDEFIQMIDDNYHCLMTYESLEENLPFKTEYLKLKI